MAPPTTADWTTLVFFLGDGQSPEDFEKSVCGMVTKTLELNGSVTESKVPDCDDPSKAFIERVINALDISYSATGFFSAETFEPYRAWWMSRQPRNAFFSVEGVPGYFSARFVCAKLTLTGNMEDGKLREAIDVRSDGEINWTAGAPPT